MKEKFSIKTDLFQQNETIMLYRYFPYYSGLEESLKKGVLCYKNAAKFNDPFDCNARLIPATHGFSPKFYGSAKEQEDRINLAIDKAKNLGILCFSRNWNNILMWAHYADSFQGLCIGFEFNRNDFMVVQSINRASDYRLYEVKYAIDDKFPHVTEMLPPLTEESYLVALLCCKAKDWSYEQEVRLIREKGDGEDAVPGRIREVIFGLKMSDENKKELKKIFENKGIKIFDSKASRCQYIVERNNFLI